MGHPKFPRKKYETPLHPWKEDRIKSERELIKKYGLKNHKEVWKAKTYLGKYRHQARELLARIGIKDPQVKRESDQILLYLTRMGILPAGSSLDDVLALETESILSRRLQTLVYLKGLSNTVCHSRQLINHGHIIIGERKVTIPSYIVTKDEEKDIGYTDKSPLNELSHPARPKTDVYKTTSPPPKTEKAKDEKKPEVEEAKDEKVKKQPPSEEKPLKKEKSDEENTKSTKEKEKPTEKSEEAEPKEEPVEKPKPEESTPAEKQPEEKDKKAEVAKEGE